MRRPHRTAVTALAGAALLLVTVPAAATPTTDPAAAAAGWLASEMVDGERIEVAFDEDVFPDHGLTADTVLALSAAGVAADSIESATDWLESEVGNYTGTDFGDTYAGATAKLAVVAAATGRDASAFGGTDLVAQLQGLETDGGRFSDVATDFETGDPADFSNTITQALALLALQRAADGPPDAAVSYLADQACDDGGFPGLLEPADCTSSVDATAFAVQALLAVGSTEAAEAGTGWLLAAQADDGSFAGDEGPNANSTGLAAAALASAGANDAAEAARDWLLSVQDGCDDAATGAIRFDPEDAGDRVRATAQALPGLVGVDLAAVASDGASTEVPVLDCSEPADDTAAAPDDEGEAADEEAEEPTEPATEADGDAAATEFPMWLLVAVVAVAVLVVVSIVVRSRRPKTTR